MHLFLVLVVCSRHDVVIRVISISNKATRAINSCSIVNVDTLIAEIMKECTESTGIILPFLRHPNER